MTDSKDENILLLARDDVKGVVFERLTSEGFVIGAVSSDADAMARISKGKFVVAIADLDLAKGGPDFVRRTLEKG